MLRQLVTTFGSQGKEVRIYRGLATGNYYVEFGVVVQILPPVVDETPAGLIATSINLLEDLLETQKEAA